MFQLTVVTAEKKIFEGEVESMVAPTLVGEVGILTNHHPMMTRLDIGPLRITKPDKSEELLFLSGGFLEVNDNVVTVLADVAENVDQIEVEQAINAKKKAQEVLKTLRSDVEIGKWVEELRVQSMRERLANLAQFKKRNSGE